MESLRKVTTKSLWVVMGLAVMVVAAGCAGMPATGKAPARLTGAQEVPPVGGNASGSTDIYAFPTKCTASTTSNSCIQIYGTVQTSGVAGTAAHIHRGKPGQNGPVIIPLVKTGENSWAVPDRTFLSDSDFGGYNDGELYVNVHSAENPNGAIRGQLVP
jgi:CHRD domain